MKRVRVGLLLAVLTFAVAGIANATESLRAEAAYAAIVRKSATPPGAVAITMGGTIVPRSAVSIYEPDGSLIASGIVTKVFGGEFYMDVDPSRYDLIEPGFLVTVNMSGQKARELASARQRDLEAVKVASEKDEAAFRAEIEREGIAEEKRRDEVALMQEQARLQMLIESQRVDDYDGYYYR